MMCKNILVPLDGSPVAEAALPYAKVLARRTGAHLTLIRAAHYASLLGDVGVEQYRSVRQAEDYLERHVERLASEGYSAQAAVPFGGSTARWIVEEAEIRHADLVVMATHDRVGADRWLHGSVAESVVHRCTIPVMLVRDGEAEQLANRFAEAEPVLVVPLDGSELAEAALPIARGLANTVGGRLVVMGVTPAPGQFVAGQGGAITTYTARDLAELQEGVRTYLQRTAQWIASGTDTDILVRSGNAATQIAEVAQERMAAAVVMATHGRTGAIRTILGSVAGNVVHRSSGPVVLVRARAVELSEPVAVQQIAASPAN
jgi:nucleotide-binding universal stress UspA family protein